MRLLKRTTVQRSDWPGRNRSHLNVGAIRVFEPGVAVVDRYAAASHVNQSQLLTHLVYPGRVVPRHREVFVGEDGDLGATGRRGQNAADLLKEVPPRVEFLALVVDRVIPVLSDSEDPIDGHSVAAQAESLRDGATQAHSVFFSKAGP